MSTVRVFLPLRAVSGVGESAVSFSGPRQLQIPNFRIHRRKILATAGGDLLLVAGAGDLSGAS